MESVIGEITAKLKQDPALFYFLIAFLSLWVIGALTGVIFVLRHLMRKPRTISSLKAMRFNPVKNNPALLQYIGNSLSRKIYKDIAKSIDTSGGPSSLNIIFGKKHIHIECVGKEPTVKIARPIGMRSKGQVLKKSITLKNLFYRTSGGIEACFAQVTNSRKIKSFGKTETRTDYGWILAMFKETSHPVTINIRPKFTGWKKGLVNTALALAQIERKTMRGLLPEFEEMFDVSAETKDENFCISKDIQNKILSFRDAFYDEQINIFLDPSGVWISSPLWAKKASQFTRLASLCEELINLD